MGRAGGEATQDSCLGMRQSVLWGKRLEKSPYHDKVAGSGKGCRLGTVGKISAAVRMNSQENNGQLSVSWGEARSAVLGEFRGDRET